jgi:hypothetical protein
MTDADLDMLDWTFHFRMRRFVDEAVTELGRYQP